MGNTPLAEGAKMKAEHCRHCGSGNCIEPFEMDGMADGYYQTKGLWWMICRDCGGSTRVNPVRVATARTTSDHLDAIVDRVYAGEASQLDQLHLVDALRDNEKNA